MNEKVNRRKSYFSAIFKPNYITIFIQNYIMYKNNKIM